MRASGRPFAEFSAKYLPAALMALGAGVAAPAAWADVPKPWQMGMQPPASPTAEAVASLNSYVLVTIILITIFVGALLAYVLRRFNHRRNPVASTVSHNTTLEIAWTTIPILILLGMAIPSFRLIYFQDRTPNPDFTIKVIAHQWYWEYQYPDHGAIRFDSYMVAADQLTDEQKAKHLRNLAVDNQLVLPAGKNIRILTTSADVIHSFFIPSLGVQRYAIPGRTIETWVRVNKPGDYYGECNQICGTNHSVMPIAVHAVTDEEFAAWVQQAKTKFSDAAPAAGTAPARVAMTTER